jgi:hypothetical protein
MSVITMKHLKQLSYKLLTDKQVDGLLPYMALAG